jgi:hypothetical protein
VPPPPVMGTVVDRIMTPVVEPDALQNDGKGVRGPSDADDGIVRRKRNVRSAGKVEPKEVSVVGADANADGESYRPDIGKQLDPLRFPASSPARHLLASPGAPAFMQLPGLLPLRENTSAWGHDHPVAGSGGTGTTRESAAEAILNAAVRARGLGIDLRRVGIPGGVDKVGKMRIYKSGRVELVFSDGTVYDCATGAPVETAQQLLAVNLGGAEDDDKTCDEICNALTSRLIARPSIQSLVSTIPSYVKKDSNALT